MITEIIEFLKEYGDVLGAIGTLSAFTMLLVTNGRVILQRLRGQKPISLQAQVFGGKTAIVVLPTKDQGCANPQFSDCLQEELHTDLQAAGFASPAPDITASAAALAKHGTDLTKRLGADYSLETSLRAQEKLCRVTARLISRDGAVVWSGRFDTASDAFIVAAEDTAQKIIGGIQGAISTPADELSGSDVAFYNPSPAQTAVGLTSAAPNIALSGIDMPVEVSPKSRFIAFLLCAVVVGIFGAHRFYVGRPFTGTLYVFTLGLLTFGWIFDLILIALGMFADGEGRPVRNFHPKRNTLAQL